MDRTLPRTTRKQAARRVGRAQRTKGDSMELQLSIGMANNPRTRAVIEGKVKPDGIDLICTPIHASELFWRQLRFGDFDVSEMSFSSLMISAANGDTRWVGLPIFTTR